MSNAEVRGHFYFGLCAFGLMFLGTGYGFVAFVLWDVSWITAIASWDAAARGIMFLTVAGLLFATVVAAINFAVWDGK